MWVSWSSSLAYLLGGLGLLIAAPFGAGAVVLVSLGLFMAALGVLFLPPVVWRLRRRRNFSPSSPAGPAASAGRWGTPGAVRRPLGGHISETDRSTPT